LIGVFTREEIGTVPKESQINKLSATSIRMKKISRKTSRRKVKSLGLMLKSTGTRLDGRKVETTPALDLGTVSKWNSQNNVLKRAKTVTVKEPFSSLRLRLLAIRRTFQTLQPLSVKL
jgi:hypothetical protein